MVYNDLYVNQDWWHPGGTHWNSWWSWGVLPGSANPDPISDQKMSLSTPFQNLAGKKLCHHN